jgi:hypothetical protein
VHPNENCSPLQSRQGRAPASNIDFFSAEG